MILKPFKVHTPDGKTFYEGDPAAKLSDDLAHAKAVMEGRAPVFVRIDAEAAPSAVVLDGERAAEYRVGWFKSSSNPRKRVRCLFEGDGIAEAEKHHSFIEWCDARAASPQATAMLTAQTDDARDAERYRFLRDDNDWHQNDRYWEAISAGGEKLDKTIDDGIKSRTESEEE